MGPGGWRRRQLGKAGRMGKLGWGPGGWRRRQLGKVGRMGKLGWPPRGWRWWQLGKVGRMGKLGWGPGAGGGMALSACCPTLSQLGQNRPSCPWLVGWAASELKFGQVINVFINKMTVRIYVWPSMAMAASSKTLSDAPARPLSRRRAAPESRRLTVGGSP